MEGTPMPQNDALVLILMMIAAVLLLKYWKQILLLLLLGVVALFGFGLYNVAYSMHG
jgi:hypothetical protein